MKIVGIITGVLMSILGVYAMCVPIRTFLGIGWLLGALLLVNGIEMIVLEFGKAKKNVWQIVLGVLGIIAGMILLFNGMQRALTDVMVVYTVGIFIIFYGVFHIIAACKKYKEAKGSSIFKIVCGVLSVIAGVLSIGHPLLTMISVGYLIAITLIFQGVDMVILALAFGRKTSEN